MAAHIPDLTTVPIFNFTLTAHQDTYAAISQCDNRGKTVLVTGASRGIGRAIANAYARSGASGIIIAARSDLAHVEQEIIASAASRAEPTTRPDVLKLQVDISSAEGVSRALAQVQQQFSSLDVLVNNAGHLEPWVPIAESDPDSWLKSWQVNMKGSYLMTRAFLPLLLKSRAKTVVNVTTAATNLVIPGASAYTASKFALLRFNEFMATEYREQGLVAIAVHPGGVPTELALNMPPFAHAFLTDTAELAADTVCWLTEERREWLTGRYVSANWDMLELLGKREEIVEGDKLKMRMVV
jgi:NAD(P)-dependent dehydrogenase (short-subunit alcohol dehydrogenase family)